MIVFLTVIYVVLLLVAFKMKVLKPTLWWKLSPIVWVLILVIALFIPMQFWAPSGPLSPTVSPVPTAAASPRLRKSIPA